MNRVFNFIGIITCIVLALKGLTYLNRNEVLYDILKNIFSLIGVVCFSIFMIWAVLRIVFGKRWMVGGAKAFIIGTDLNKAINQTLNELPNPTKPTIANLGTHLVYRFTRLGIIGLGLALIPIVLLWQQNEKIEVQNKWIERQTILLDSQDQKFARQNELFYYQNNLFIAQNEKVDTQINLTRIQTTLLDSQNVKFGLQNHLITDQNDLFKTQNKLVYDQNQRIDTQTQLLFDQNERINVQNNLIEADRRGSLVFLMSNVLDKVDEELKEQKDSLQGQGIEITDSIKYSLSKPLVQRIIGLSRALKPYKILQGDTLSKEDLSPERGQLFIALMESGLDSITQNTIVENGNFENAVIGKINLQDASLQGANLQGANLQGANFSGANLQRANFQSANLSGANLQRANLQKADLQKAILSTTNFQKANLSRANFRDAYLGSANLRDAKLPLATLSYVNLRKADLRDADLRGVNLNDANLSRADFRDANLSRANLRDANLFLTQLVRANLRRADLKRADLKKANLGMADLTGTDVFREYIIYTDSRIGEGDSRRDIHLTANQLIKAQSLYKTVGLDSTTRSQVIKEGFECLFDLFGCPEDKNK